LAPRGGSEEKRGAKLCKKNWAAGKNGARSDFNKKI